MSFDARKPTPPARPVGIKDIARALGISIGTVDRALHAKPGVNAMTRARVLSMAESLGYRPNLAARYLKSPKQLKISVHLPREIALFWDSLREGIREAAAPFAPGLHVEVQSYPRLGEGDVPLFEHALNDGTNGLIVAPGDPASLTPYITRAAGQNVPVVCVVTDAPDSERMTFVSAEPFTVGALAGELLARCQPQGGRVAFFTGWLSTQDHAAAAVVVGANGTPEKPKGTPVFAWKGETLEEYWWCTKESLVWPDGSGPTLIVDDGGDATLVVHKGAEFEQAGSVPPFDPHGHPEEWGVILDCIKSSIARDPKRWTRLASSIRGVSE